MSGIDEFSALLIDDSSDIRRLCKRALEAESIECTTAEDASQAEEHLRARNYDIIISDLRMPRKHGHRLMLELRDLGDRTPFVVISGVTDPRIVRDLLKRGVLDVITKPFNYALFAVRIRHLLETREPLVGQITPQIDPQETLARQLEGTSSVLQQQLHEVTKSFEATIAELNKRRGELETGYLGSVRILANLIEQVGQSRRSHVVRVEGIAEALARKVGYPESEVLNLRIAALLHEIGAFGMPDSIRQKAPWELDFEDRSCYEHYPEIGATFLSELRDGKPVVDLVEYHAENYDGTGFPMKRSGDDIPLGARILRLADGCDTYLMHCGAENRLDALQVHLLQEKGRNYDPKLVPLAVEHFDQQLRNEDESFLISISAYHSGLVLAENIFDCEGRFLVREGVELTESLFRRIQRMLNRDEIRVKKAPCGPT